MLSEVMVPPCYSLTPVLSIRPRVFHIPGPRTPYPKLVFSTPRDPVLRTLTPCFPPTTLDVLSWKFPPRPRELLEIPTQSMDTNFYPNIELGGMANFFQHLRPRLKPSTYCLGNFPAPPFTVGNTNAINGHEFLPQH